MSGGLLDDKGGKSYGTDNPSVRASYHPTDAGPIVHSELDTSSAAEGHTERRLPDKEAYLVGPLPMDISTTIVADFTDGDDTEPYVLARLPVAMYLKLKQKVETIPWWHPEHRPFLRFIVLVLCCLIGVGGYVGFDSIGVVEKELEEALDIDDVQFGLLYSIYSFPNIGLAFLGGYALDKLGLRVGAFVTLSIMLFGAGMTLFAGYIKNYNLMLAGRVFFGIGTEMSHVTQDFIATAWFYGRYLSFALGIEHAAGSLGSFLTFSLSGALVEKYDDWRIPLIFAAMVITLSFIGAITYCGIDWFTQRILGRRINEQEESEETGSIWKGIWNLPADYWMVNLISIGYYMMVFPFQSNGTAFMEERYFKSESEAANIISLLPLTTVVATPFWGMAVDNIGYNAIFGQFAIGLLTASMGALYWDVADPAYCVVVMGVAYSLLPVSLYPCVPKVTPPAFLGLAYGLAYSACDLGMVVAYAIVGAVTKNDKTGDNVLILYMITGLFASLMCLLLSVMDYRKGKRINHPGKLIIAIRNR
eukprot:TRINITY_DN7727_c0_g1_i1.p1 TRINITY_DN7727_c0_g1~~TRINITY_DN7727_c0_g1_i1.p1  ORF type:complete len:532 (-),score=103.20 TRINITY_DN7727_c0_g1_i1:341-1936(-)